MSVQKQINILTLLFSTLLLISCGEESKNSQPQEEPEISNPTETLIANEHFNFALEQTLQLNIVNPNHNQGAIHLYYGIDHIFEDGSIVADPTTRLTSIDAKQDNLVKLSLNKNIKQLIWHWVPTERAVTEQLGVIEIDNISGIYQLHL